MKTLQVDLPEALGKLMESLVQQGWFHDEQELTRQALTEFVRRHRFELDAQFQLEDIDWALGIRDATS